MSQLTRGQTVGIVALLVVVTGWVGVTALHSGQPPFTPGIVVRESLPAAVANSSMPPVGTGTPVAALNPPAIPGNAASEIVVHVAGAVKKPGVYHLKPGARNDDAVHAAGGFAVTANPDAINLAARSEDGSQLYVPNRLEHPSGGPVSHEALSAASAHDAEASGVPAHPKSVKSSGRSGHSADKLSDPSQGQVNLNTADATQLQHIPGIGPAMAERILTYRRSAGRFQSPDDLLQVSGIGDKKFQKMRPYLSVR